MAMDIPIPNVGRQLTKEKLPDMMKGNMLLLSFPVSIILMRVPTHGRRIIMDRYI